VRRLQDADDPPFELVKPASKSVAFRERILAIENPVIIK